MENESHSSVSILNYGQTKLRRWTILRYLDGYDKTLVTNRATSNHMLGEDSAFEVHENVYHNVCTELGGENSFVENLFAGKPGSPNTNPENEGGKESTRA